MESQKLMLVLKKINKKKKPKLRVPHLAFPPGLGSEDHCTIPPRLLKSHPPCPCWIWGGTRQA